MTPALTPAVALDYLHELSADIDAGVVLAADGTLLAGAEELAPAARDLLAAAGDATDVHVTTADRAVFAARDPKHAIVVATGRFALPSLARYDLRMVLADLAGERPRSPGRADSDSGRAAAQVPRLPRKPSAPRPYGVGAVTAGWSRRRAAKEPRVVIREASGQPHALRADDPRAQALQEAAERLISAVQRAPDT